MKSTPEENALSESPTLHFELPALPGLLRYYDDFIEDYITLRNLNEYDIWDVHVSGERISLKIFNFPRQLKTFIKHWCIYLFQNLSPATAVLRFTRLQQIESNDLINILTSTPINIRNLWDSLLAKQYDNFHLSSLKSVLRFLCSLRLGSWSKEYNDFVNALKMPYVDKYAKVRAGEVFLSTKEESLLVQHFDSISQSAINNPHTLSDDELRDTSILICSFQFGLRPAQIGRVKMSDVRIWKNNNTYANSVHLTFKMSKQRSASRSLPMTRKIKPEWAPIFIELHNRSLSKGSKAKNRLFEVDSAKKTASIIIKKTGKLLPNSRSATDLRHTAAQRLVDAGANQEELAEFMGHSDIETGLVYFQASANQAERVNQALGISSVYQKVAKIAHDRFISQDELLNLKGEQQIAGVPHGIAISGIGGCASGQPACPYNPVTACYGCQKFMPINDIEIHESVLDDFRSVVTFFASTSREDNSSPAYLQLKRTISNVQSVITELKE